MELVGGQEAGGDPAVQLVGVDARISRFSGVKVQADSSGRPEQESVTNMGAVNVALFCGVMVTVAVPEFPGMRVSAGVEAGERLETETAKLGVVPA